jgi:DNA processing protein
VTDRDASIREAVDLLTLAALPGVGLATVHALVTAFGSPASALRARAEDFAAVAGLRAARARSDESYREEAVRGLDRARAAGAVVRTWSSPEYPAGLRHLADPPPVLFFRGGEELLRRPCVTIVGARRATERGRDVAHRLGRALAARGVTVISGLALGVDGAAHRGALQAGGSTVAVLGTGVDVPYPAAHRRLYREIGLRGLLVSEFLPGTRAAPHHFPRRNRILAALTSRVVVIEAGARSGSLITVDHALDLGREVWAVPGPIDQTTCVGSNRLLVDGARPLVSVEAFAEEVAPWAMAPAPAEAVLAACPAPLPTESRVESQALIALEDGPATVDDVAVRLRLPVGTALAVLTTLELHGEVERLPGMRFRRAA